MAGVPDADVANLRGIITQYSSSRALYAAVALDIAAALAGGAKVIDELAAAVGAHAASLYRLLRVLAAPGIFREQEGRRFTYTPLSELL